MSRVKVQGRAPVTQRSRHRANAPLDLCYTPAPTGMIPIPYVNSATSANLRRGSGHVRIGGARVMLAGSELNPSHGNEAGTGGGVVSRTTRGKTVALNATSCVRIEGKGVVLAGAITRQNGGNCYGSIR